MEQWLHNMKKGTDFVSWISLPWVRSRLSTPTFHVHVGIILWLHSLDSFFSSWTFLWQSEWVEIDLLYVWCVMYVAEILMFVYLSFRFRPQTQNHPSKWRRTCGCKVSTITILPLPILLGHNYRKAFCENEIKDQTTPADHFHIMSLMSQKASGQLKGLEKRKTAPV